MSEQQYYLVTWRYHATTGEVCTEPTYKHPCDFLLSLIEPVTLVSWKLLTEEEFHVELGKWTDRLKEQAEEARKRREKAKQPRRRWWRLW